MMRPIYFFSLMIGVVPAPMAAQDAVAAAMRTVNWPVPAAATATAADQGIGWSVFSKQYYCVSNWNATGISVDYTSATQQSAALIYRDGIPGFSWYHLYLSHFRQFKKIGGMLQLRLSLIDLKDRPMIFRLGGNIRASWSMSQTLLLQVSMYDFPGWILPEIAIARDDPVMQFLLFHEPGRLVGLATGFRISRSQFGPVTAGIRMNLNDRIGMIGLFDVLPFGISLGIHYQINGYKIDGWLEHRNGIGLSPIVVIRND